MSIAVHAFMNRRLLTVTLISTWLAMAVGAPVALAAPPVLPRPAASATAQRAPIARTQGIVQPDRAHDAARYAAAERAKPDAAHFEGGATVVIVGSTAAMVLGVLLLLVLL